MGQNIPAKVFRLMGDGVSNPTRLAVSHTPDSDITVRHFSFVAQRAVATSIMYTEETLNEVNTIEWEIRSAAANHKPNTTSASLLASGSFDWRYTSSWKTYRPIKFTVNLTSGLALTASTEYWFILKMPSDESHARYPLAWATTYETGAGSEVDATIYCSYYTDSAWVNGSNSFNLTLYVLDAQAGVTWHTVIDGNGYMQPDRLRGYRCEMVASGLAATRGGQEEYSQLRYPYSNFSQDDWTSGSGQLEVEDPNAYLYAACTDTTIPNQAIMGPAVHLTGADSDNPEHIPTTMIARHLIDAELSTPAAPVRYYAQKFQAPTGGMTATKVGIRVNRMPWQRQHTISVALYSDSGGSPDSILGSWVALSPTYKWHWRDATVNQALSSETDYWVVVRTSQTWGAIPEYRVMFDQDGSASGGAAKYSTDASSWSVLTGHSMVFRINYGAADALDGTVSAIKYGVVNGTNYLIAAAGKKVYKWVENDGDWVDISTGIEGAGNDETTADIVGIHMFNDLLFVSQGYANNVRYWNESSWADAGYAAKHFHTGKGYMWVTTNYNKVKHTNDGTTMSSEITVGESTFDINAFVNYQGRLLVGKENGIWEIDDQDLAIEYMRFDAHSDQNNCIGMTVWSGMLFIPIQHSIWRWQGAQYREVGPTDLRSGQTSEWPNRIKTMAATSNLLWAVAENDVSPGWGGLMAYNGLGWHHVAIATRQDLDTRAIEVTTEVGSANDIRIWYGEGDRITYVKFPNFTHNRYDWSSADYEITACSLHTSWWHGGVKDALKFWNRLTLLADLPDDTSIEVYCARDGGGFESSSDILFLGEVTNQHLTDTGEYVLMFPDGMVAKMVQFIFILNTQDNTKTPRLRAFNAEAIVRQIPVYTYTFRILLSNNLTKMDGTTESSRTANDMWEGLQRAAASNEPVIVSFPEKTIRAMVTYLREETYQFVPDGMTSEQWERVAVVSVVEAT